MKTMQTVSSWWVVGAISVLGIGAVHGQEKPAFEVAVVRQSQPGATQHMGPTADGYQMASLPLLVPILSAYVPAGGGDSAFFTNDRVKGAPDWARSERYDIDAKVSEADLAAWHTPATQKPLLQAMLQTLLAERCKLAVHREMQEIPTYALVLGKNGPKLADAKPDEPHPGGVPLPGGAVLVPSNGGQVLHFYAATMVSLAQVLSNFAGRPVQDQTGLTGRYDFVVDKSSGGAPLEPAAAEDSGPAITTVVQTLGLRLQPAKAQVETLVIDHMERPAKNE